MPDLGPYAAPLSILAVLVIMGWFALGTQANIRIGNDLLRWLQGGLPLIGRKTTMRWVGSSAVELGVADAKEPFREATVLFVLEPRDVGILWAWSRRRGRRDFLIFRLNLRRAPRYSFEVGDPSGWTGDVDEPGPGEGWHRLALPGAGIRAWAGPGTDDALVREAWERLSRLSGGVWKLAVQPVVPHLEVHLRPPDTRRVRSEELLAAVRDLAVEVMPRD